MRGNASLRAEDPAGAPAVNASDFKEGMSRLAAAVSIVTTMGTEGPSGFTASAVCSVTDTPPTLLICLNRSASVYPAFEMAQTLCVNVLGADHGELGLLFGGRTSMEERFARNAWAVLHSGAPVLDGAAVSFDCRIAARTSVGSHDVLFCEVVAIGWREETSGLVYFRRQFHGLPRG